MELITIISALILGVWLIRISTNHKINVPDKHECEYQIPIYIRERGKVVDCYYKCSKPGCNNWIDPWLEKEYKALMDRQQKNQEEYPLVEDF